MKPYFKPIVAVALSFLIFSCNKNNDADKELPLLGDVTGQVVLLDNPLNQQYKDNTEKVYARNIWDMHAFNGKIYFGGGNSSNDAPASNAGPADLWSYNPSTQQFTKEYTVNDEQIHRIREFDNQLYIPGHDSRGSWDFGNFYRLEAGVWKKYDNIPEAVHVYDIYKRNGKLFAAIAPASPKTSNMQVSDDDGKSWRSIFCGTTPKLCECYGRVYGLFPLAGKLYSYYYFPYLMEYSGKENIFTYQPYDAYYRLFKDEKGKANRIERALVFNDQTVYIIGATCNDHQYLPISLLCASDLSHINKLALPEGALPRDILVKGKWLVVLVSTKIDNHTCRNAVLLTDNISQDSATWTELFHFTAGTFARSFEYMNDTFYFGMGCETDLLAPDTGNILSFGYKI